MNSRSFTVKLFALFVLLSFAALAYADVDGSGITPEQAIERLIAGNAQVVSGSDADPNAEAAVARMLKEIHGKSRLRATLGAKLAAGLFAVLAIIIGIGIAVYQTRRLTRRIGQTVDIADRVAAGDLTKQLDASGSDELDQLARAINRMIGNLQEVVQQIGTAGTNMVGASREQAEGAKSQSTATAEMTSTVAELTTSATRMSENGAAVSEQAELASKECSAGSLSVQNAVQGIQGIHERVEKIAEHMLDLGAKSKQISGILDIITELSEQTNLLSLNASIEAAGAGEAGKRFAVVASEIRKLAECATGSTVEIRALIDSIQETVNTTIMATEEGTKAVQHGVRMSEDVEAFLQRIAQQVGATTESAKSIEMGSRQQATAIQQTEEAVRNIDAAAQQSEATARQVDGEAHALLKSARRLQTSDRQSLAV